MYHYEECGLDNVWLLNGYIERETPYGKAVAVEHADELDAAIARALVDSRRRLSAAEFRFLRKQLGQSQVSMARALGCSHETVSKWERDGNVPAMADRFVRAYWREVQEGNAHILELLERLAEMDTADNEAKLVLEETEAGWRKAA